MNQITKIIRNIFFVLIGVGVAGVAIWASNFIGMQISFLSGEMEFKRGTYEDLDQDVSIGSIAIYSFAAMVSAVIGNLGGLLAGILLAAGFSIKSLKELYHEATKTWTDIVFTFIAVGIVATSEIFLAVLLHNFLRGATSILMIAVGTTLFTGGGVVLHLYDFRTDSNPQESQEEDSQ